MLMMTEKEHGVKICCNADTQQSKYYKPTSPSASSKRIHPSIPADTKLFSHGISQLPQVVVRKLAIGGIRPQDKGGWSCLCATDKANQYEKLDDIECDHVLS